MAGVGVSAKTIVSKAKSQLGQCEHPMGSNRQKYGAAYGMNGVAWCVIFVWWVFTYSGGHCPFGKLAGVPSAAARMSNLHKGGAGQAKAGDIRCTPGNTHIGICVANGGRCIAGNSGEAVRYEPAGGTYYRPKYTPDVYAVRLGNGKIFYYNPKTKKMCTDKEGKHPIQGRVNAITGGAVSSGRGGSGSGSGSGSSYKERVIPYREYYYTKPKNFEDVKDQSYTSSIDASELDQSIRVLTVEMDWQRLQDVIQGVVKPNLDNTYELSPLSLCNHYIKMINIMKQSLKPFNKEEGKECMSISGDEAALRQCIYIDIYHADEEQPYLNYYQVLDSDWIELFNELTLKRDVLLMQIEANKTYTPLFQTNIYYSTRNKDINDFYNSQISVYYNRMQNYIKDNSGKFSNADQILDLNKKIKNLEIELNKYKQELNNKFNNLPKIKKSLKDYQNLFNNMIDFEKTFKQNNFSDKYIYWNKNIIQSPKSLNFWLDFLDNNSEISKYSVQNIGFQQYAMSNTNINSLYTRKIPDIIYYEDKINQKKTGYLYLQLTNDKIDNLFVNSIQGISAKNQIDELLYLHTTAAEEININAIPIYYLEPNTRLFIYDKNASVNGEYIINRITQQLSHNSTMTINASFVPKRLY